MSLGGDANIKGDLSIDGNTTLGESSNDTLVLHGIFASNIPDNATDAFDMQEGSNDYINVSTMNGSETITFGNTTTNPTFIFNGTGNVGIGTTNPLAKLHVAGECVVGNTLLPIKRRKKRKNGQEDEDADDEWPASNAFGEADAGWDDLLGPIKDVQEGDLVASLDETTGEIVYRPIRKLLNKGFQKVV